MRHFSEDDVVLRHTFYPKNASNCFSESKQILLDYLTSFAPENDEENYAYMIKKRKDFQNSCIHASGITEASFRRTLKERKGVMPLSRSEPSSFEYIASSWPSDKAGLLQKATSSE